MKTRHTIHRLTRSRVLALAVGLAVVVTPLAGAAPSHAASPRMSERPAAVVELGPSLHAQSIARPRVSVTGTVPNYFVRECSYITGRCTGYRQTNGPYNPSVPSRYATKWVWRAIW